MTPQQYLSLALDPPDPSAVVAALTTLEEVGAVVTLEEDEEGDEGEEEVEGDDDDEEVDEEEVPFESKTTANSTEKKTSKRERRNRIVGRTRIEPLGFLLAQMPADVRIGKVLIMASIMQCLRPALIIAASLAFKTPFVTPVEKRTEARLARKEYLIDDEGKQLRSDHLSIVRAYEAFSAKLASKEKSSSLRRWCRMKFLSYSTLMSMKTTIREFEGYLTNMKFLTKFNYDQVMTKHAQRPFVVLAALASGLWPNVATITRSSSTAGSLPVIAVKNRVAAIHPSSINQGIATERLLLQTSCRTNGFLCYHDMMQTSKCYLRDTSIVSSTSILLLCGNGRDAAVTFGRQHVVVNGWIRVHVTSKAAVLITRLRKILNSFLLEKVANPTMEESKEYRELTKMMTRLLEV